MIAVLLAVFAAAVAVHSVLAYWAAGQLLYAAAAVVVAGLAIRMGWWFAFPGRGLPRNRVRTMRLRVRLGLRPGPGHATGVECWLRWGRFAAFRRSRRARPSLSAWCRYWRPCEHSVLIGRAYVMHGLRAPSEEHVLVMARPRTRKTGFLADMILTWPGPVLATSTKPDLFALTSGVRDRTGQPYVFNPQGIGAVPSTFGWDPVPGCQEPAVAIRRADDFTTAVDQKGVEGGGWFGKRAGAYMRALFCAAALDGQDLRAVAGWALGLELAEAQEILRRHGRDRWAQELGQLRGEARRTVETIQMTMAAALGFVNDPRLLECVLPAEGYGLDIPGFLRERGTLYLIGRMQGEDAPLAPLFAALAGEIHYQGVLLASMQPGGRLDPPLLMALDEATQICPCPIPTWLADSGGQGITIATVCHGEAQLAARWGEHGKQTIMDTSGVKIFMPGTTATSTLDTVSKLCGDTAYTEHGQEHSTRHPILTDAMVRQMPDKYELVLRGGLSPVICRVPVAWRNWRYLLAHLRGRHIAAVHAAPTAVGAERLTELEPVPPVTGPWPGAEFRAAPVSPDTQHPWNTATDANGPRGHGANGKGSDAGGGHDGR
jgi:type IV secretory pathway TraG/TraD family ATPase VirD4